MDDADFALAMMLQAQENEARAHDDAALAWSQNNGEFLAMKNTDSYTAEFTHNLVFKSKQERCHFSFNDRGENESEIYL